MDWTKKLYNTQESIFIQRNMKPGKIETRWKITLTFDRSQNIFEKHPLNKGSQCIYFLGTFQAFIKKNYRHSFPHSDHLD